MTLVEDIERLLPGRSQLDLLTAQIAAIDAWNLAQHAEEAAAEAELMTRERRLDLNRRIEARRREQEALIARADDQLRDSGDVLRGRARTRAVLAHRNEWLRDSVAQRLESRGVCVVGVFEDGAAAAGTAVVEQPDLVFVEERLPTMSGVEVLRRVRRFSPGTVVGIQCLDGDGIRPLVDAGAQAVFTRRVPPHEMADELLHCLASRGVPVSVA